MANKEAVFSLRVDTGKSVSEISAFEQGLNDASKATQNLDNKVTDVNATFEQVYGELQPLTTRLGEAEDRLYELALAGDTTSQQYKELLETVARYRKTQIETDMVVDQASKTFGEKLAGGVGTAAELFSGFESATALLGVESEQLVQTMVRLQAVQGLANAVSQIQIKIKEKDALFTGIQTAAQKTYSFAVGQSTGAMKLFRTALLATGVGALVVLIAALITNFDDLKKAIFGSSEAADAMRETMEAYKQGAQGAIESTTQVGNAFELARQGVISKEEALHTYNETLGDSFGRTTDINKAEEMYIQKKDAFIKATAARAQAQALFSKAAEEQVKAIVASTEDQRDWAEKTVSFFGDAVAGYVDYTTNGLVNIDKEVNRQQGKMFKDAQNREKKEAERRSKMLNDLAVGKLKEAEITENANGIISENEKKTQDEIAAKRKEAYEKAQKLKEKQLEEAKKAWEKEKELSQKHADELSKIIENRVKKEDDIIRQGTVTKEELIQREIDRINKLRDKEFRDAIGFLEGQLTNDENNFKLRAELLEIQKQQELSNKELTEGEIFAIEQKYAKQSKDLQTERLQNILDTAQFVKDQVSQFNQALNDLQNARLESSQAAADEQIASLEKQQASELNSSNLTAEQRAAIDKKYAQAKYAIELKNFQEVEKIKKQQFERDKALRIAQVAIDTATAIVKGIAQFGPPPSPAGIAAIASAAIIGATQIAAIAAQKYQAGTAPSLNTGGGGVNAGATAGQLGGNAANANLNTQQQNTAELIGQSNQGGQVYVLESDITGTQDKVNMQNKLSVW